ncbi:MAG: glutathione ABC transporter permease GsiC [Myxococcales bacterium]|nr:glutathione ABC transporter permease GsiC [Myxococcales bacterium]
MEAGDSSGGSAAYWVRRAVSSIIVIWGVATLVFVTLRLVPGDPVESILGEQALEVDKEKLRQCLDLHLSLPVQYGHFMVEVATGTFGELCDQKNVTVRDKLLESIPPTLELAVASMLMAILIAIPLGVISALKRGTWIDAGAAFVSLLGLSMPNFWLGPMLLILFSITLRVLPDPGAGIEGLAGLILPAITLGTALSAKLTRMTRTSVLEVLGQDHVRTARAKGLSERVVVARHVLRNALIPVTTIAGLQLGALLTGAIIVEKVFARPGLGSLLLEAIEMRNYRVVQGCVLVIALTYVVVNLLTDLLYTRIDPRVSLTR